LVHLDDILLRSNSGITNWIGFGPEFSDQFQFGIIMEIDR